MKQQLKKSEELMQVKVPKELLLLVQVENKIYKK